MEEEKTELSREEILERSREENKKGDELSKKTAMRVGGIVMIFFVIAILVTECVIYKKVKFSYGLYATIWGMTGSEHLTQGILNRKKRTILFGISYCLLGIGGFVCFVIAMLRF